MSTDVSELVIPAELLPVDGRFGSGPAKIRPEALRALGGRNDIMGTSHRQAPVKALVGEIQQMLLDLLEAPADRRVVLGCGGATFFWDIATSCLIRRRSAHAVFGEFGAKFAAAAQAAPFLDEPLITRVPTGQAMLPVVDESIDLVGWPQNETSTGACLPVLRPEGLPADALVAIDATSSAGGMRADLSVVDAYYFAAQKNLSSDGGLWFAVCSPRALDRAAELTSQRWVPASLNLTVAAQNSAKQQTYNTPAIGTLVLLADQLHWMLDQGGLDFVVRRTTESSQVLYRWAEQRSWTSPYIADPRHRSPMVVTIDFDAAVDADRVCAILRRNGIVDINAYRNLGRNQIRVGVFASVDPEDVRALTACLDWAAERVTA